MLATLVQVWEIFDYPCGQRLAPVLRQELERLRKARELHCSDAVAEKLGRISAKTIDRLLAQLDRVPDRPDAFDPLEWDAHGLPK